MAAVPLVDEILSKISLKLEIEFILGKKKVSSSTEERFYPI